MTNDKLLHGEGNPKRRIEPTVQWKAVIEISKMVFRRLAPT